MADIRKLQLFELEILKELDRICKKHNISYVLGFGSCLGAVRHQGIIPWDDDIDVQMLWSDYIKFAKVCKTELGEKFYYQNHAENPLTYSYWTCIGVKNSTSINMDMSMVHTTWGICIDIFPVFFTNEEDLKKDAALLDKAVMLSLKHYHLNTLKGTSGITRLKKSMHALLPDKLNQKLFSKCIDKLCKNSEKPGRTIAILEPGNYVDKSIFDDVVYLPFEGEKFPCPSGYDAYLSTLYGDYMTPPETVVKHTDGDNMIVKFDEPYTNYWR